MKNIFFNKKKSQEKYIFKLLEQLKFEKKNFLDDIIFEINTIKYIGSIYSHKNTYNIYLKNKINNIYYNIEIENKNIIKILNDIFKKELRIIKMKRL